MHSPTRLIATLSMALTLAAPTLVNAAPPGGGGGGNPPPLPAIENVGIDQKDYQGNLTTTDRGIAPGSHPALEYDQSPGHNVMVSHIAYVKGAAATVKLRIYNRRTTPVSGSLTFSSARLAVPGPSISDPGPCYLPLSISVSPSTFSLSPNTTADLTATISGLPAYVAVGALQVNFSMPVTVDPGTPQAVAGNNGSDGNWNTWERICILDATPIGLQAVPWTDFLEYSCRWAFGASGTAEVRREMTKGIHRANRSPFSRLMYNPNEGAQYWAIESDGSPNPAFDLSSLLENLGNPIRYSFPVIWASGDCRDFAGILKLALASHGAPSWCAIVKAEAINGDTGFAYWPLCPAGTDSTVTTPVTLTQFGFSKSGNYEALGFVFHVLVHENTDLWYDASSSYLWSSSGADWQDPVFEWSEATYWQRSTQPYFGLTYHRFYIYDFQAHPARTGSVAVPLDEISFISPTGVI